MLKILGEGILSFKLLLFSLQPLKKLLFCQVCILFLSFKRPFFHFFIFLPTFFESFMCRFFTLNRNFILCAFTLQRCFFLHKNAHNFFNFLSEIVVSQNDFAYHLCVFLLSNNGVRVLALVFVEFHNEAHELTAHIAYLILKGSCIYPSVGILLLLWILALFLAFKTVHFIFIFFHLNYCYFDLRLG